MTSSPATNAYSPQRVVDGYLRPYGGPHLWSTPPVGAAALAADPAWISLAWDAPIQVSSVRLVWNDDVDEDLINLHHHRTSFAVIPELAADYVIEGRVGGEWRGLDSVTDNRHRHRIHDVQPVSVEALRVRVSRTNGSPYVTLSGVRVYSEQSGRAVTLPWR